ncbi:bifunctional acetate--CoA ligase family protein/GNAT family N-acetyltransferase [Rhodobium gokarnense]|uniref:Acetyltransferase n=1 Tax=Rhodobium gokarnense TaxID=364296 RepID=A0ABT3HCR6_9HYPH|nr:GNAT family N-acetyltransferase [Rhodobium gokarnense]MCW2308086.1 acetyltransferase [Rhodobium gokarnense]
MTVRNLDVLMRPASLGVIGPNRFGDKAKSILFDRIAASGFPGDRIACAIDGDIPDGFTRSDTIDGLSAAPELAVLLAGSETSARDLEALADKGTKAVVLMASGFDAWDHDTRARMVKTASACGIRVVGPGSLGIISPHAKLDVSLSAHSATPGDLALVSRSGAVVNAMLAWGAAHHVGFSGVVSLGQKTDISVGDMLDWFANDYRTRAILLHLESISNPGLFMSAARAAARSKPVIVLRSGAYGHRRDEVLTESARLATPDAAYDAAFQRAGLLRVRDLDEMFDAAETVSRFKPGFGRRLAIVGNGHSLANVASDRLQAGGGQIAKPSPESREELKKFLRPAAANANPFVLDNDAPPEHFSHTIAALMADKQTDGVLVVIAPNAFISTAETVTAIAETAKKTRRASMKKKPVTVVLADEDPALRQMLEEAGIPCYRTPSEAVRGFMHLVRYAEGQELLMRTPPSLPAGFTPAAVRARTVIERCLIAGRNWLDPTSVRILLSAYGIPVMESIVVTDGAEAEVAAHRLATGTRRFAIKIASPDIPFHSDVDGVWLDLPSPAAVADATEKMLERMATEHPDKRIDGVVVQPMLDARHAHELVGGITDDPVFGPLIVLGGVVSEGVIDLAVDLPPLDLNLARLLLQRADISHVLAGSRHSAAIDPEAIAHLLVRLSQIAIDFPEIRDLDLDPIVIESGRMVVLDARVAIGPVDRSRHKLGHPRLTIRPYPQEWERNITLKDGRPVFLRPIRPEDEVLYDDFFAEVSDEDMRLRFFAPIKEFTHAFLSRLTQIDYARAMAFIALDGNTGQLLGVVRLHADADHDTGEYAVLIRSPLKGLGLGWVLMNQIIEYARADGIKVINGEVLHENGGMLAICEALGFSVRTSEDDRSIAKVTLEVTPDADASPVPQLEKVG